MATLQEIVGEVDRQPDGSGKGPALPEDERSATRDQAPAPVKSNIPFTEYRDPDKGRWLRRIDAQSFWTSRRGHPCGRH